MKLWKIISLTFTKIVNYLLESNLEIMKIKFIRIRIVSKILAIFQMTSAHNEWRITIKTDIEFYNRITNVLAKMCFIEILSDDKDVVIINNILT